ncbi:MAG: hypothetical protein WDN06_04225 [Asticcacaulis sp.]
MADDAGTAKPSTLQAITAYARPKPLLLLALGFTTGIPFLLIGETLTAWLRVDGLSLSVIGFFILVSFSYTLKFMWAPLIDRLDIPFLTAKLGHRRSWMAVLQVLIVLCLLCVAMTDPTATFSIILGTIQKLVFISLPCLPRYPAFSAPRTTSSSTPIASKSPTTRRNWWS